MVQIISGNTVEFKIRGKLEREEVWGQVWTSMGKLITVRTSLNSWLLYLRLRNLAKTTAAQYRQFAY